MDLCAKEYFVSTFYNFQKLDQPNQVKLDLEKRAIELHVLGLIIIGHEGFNATISCPDHLDFLEFKDFICEYLAAPGLFFKDSVSNKNPFRRFKVKIREEIVTLGTPELIPDRQKNHHLSPAEWNQVMKDEKDVLVIDTRNWYETKIGTFKNAVNPRIDKFTEFPKFVEENKLDKRQKMLIFCTGGIRCEKGILELQRQGFDEVYQLEGGIINYLKEFPNDQYEGECFVFDHRVALDQNLAPSKKYDLCPHCGQPANIEKICKHCETPALICDECIEISVKQDTCSKNCAYQYPLKLKRQEKQQQA